MANTVQANVNVNIRTNAEQASEQILDVAGALDRLATSGSAFNDVNENIENVGRSLNSAGEASVDFSGILTQLAKSFGLSNSQASGLVKTLGATATEAAAAGVAIGVIVGILKLYVDRLKEAEQALIKFGEGALDAGVNGVEFFIEAISSLVDTLQEAMDKMYEFAEAGAEIQRTYFKTFTTLGSEAGGSVISFTEKLEELYGLDGTQFLQDMQGIVTAAADLGVSTGDMTKATQNMALMANDLSVIAGDFNKASTDIANAVSRGTVAKTSSLYLMMTKQEKEYLASLSTEVERYNYLMSLSERIKGRYVDYLQTEAGQLLLLNNRYGALKSNIQLLALGLYAKIAPVLTKLIELANTALTFIMKVFNIDLKGSADIGTGSIAENIANGMKDIGDASNKSSKDVKKSTKESAKSIKELERQVASFDDVIQIKDSKANDDTLGIGDLEDLNANLDDSGIKDLIGDFDLLKDAVGNTNSEFDDFRKLLEAGEYEKAGEWIAEWFTKKLNAIPWEDIQDKAKKLGTGLAEFLNGINRDKSLWIAMGKTLAEALNTAFDFLLSFAKEFDFKVLGDSIGVAWKNFWETFDEEDAAETLYEWFMGAFELLGGLFDNNPLSTLAESLVKTIHNFFENIDEEDEKQMADTLKSILNDVFRAAFTLTEGAAEDAPKIIEILKNLIGAAKDWFENGGGKEYLKGIVKNIISILDDILDSGLVDDAENLINEFIAEIDLSGILSRATKIAFQVWRAETERELKLLWEEIKSIWETLDIGGAFKRFGQLILALIVLYYAKLYEWYNKIINGVANFFVDIGIKAKEGLQKIWSNITKTVSEWFSKIKEWVQKIKDAITQPFENLNPFKNISLPSFNISMPWSGKHATGGITNGASIGMIGEAGREAILPLDKNTGWMDILASKISNNGNNSSPVVIDISSANKPVYTRSEYLALADVFAEAMKARGMVVSMEY